MFRNRELAGFESDEASKKYGIALDKFDAARDRLKQLAKDDALLSREAEKKMPEKYKKDGMIWFKAGIEEMKAMKERDKAVVENMISRNQSGILFIGLWHLDSVANLMKQHCIQENNIPVRRSESTLQRAVR